MICQGEKMHLSRAFLLLCLPGCLTLSIPGVLNGTVGGTLVMKCQYRAGEEGLRKFWCRGLDWRICKRVIETARVAGQEVRRGRVTLRDSPTELTFLVIMEDLEEGDADTYWCGVDRSFRRASVAVTVFPGPVTAATRTPETSASTGALDLTSPASSPGLPARPFLLSATFLFLVLMKAVLFLSFGCAAVWLAWLQHHL